MGSFTTCIHTAHVVPIDVHCGRYDADTNVSAAKSLWRETSVFSEVSGVK